MDTKTAQLCSQVQEAISWALACSTSPLLRDLHVARVEPRKGAALLQVFVATEVATAGYEETVAALRRANGYLRREVAAAIHRKKVPTLQFMVLPSATGWDDTGAR